MYVCICVLAHSIRIKDEHHEIINSSEKYVLGVRMYIREEQGRGGEMR